MRRRHPVEGGMVERLNGQRAAIHNDTILAHFDGLARQTKNPLDGEADAGREVRLDDVSPARRADEESLDPGIWHSEIVRRTIHNNGVAEQRMVGAAEAPVSEYGHK